MRLPSILLLLSCGTKTENDTSCEARTWYTDGDGDGYGAGPGEEHCSAPTGFTEVPGDCDDADAEVHPVASELCNGLDDNCDGTLDPPASIWYLDQDGDGYGNAEAPVEDCAQPKGTVEDATDCNDSDPAAWPGAPDTWYDGFDSDCGGDDDFDADLDGYATNALIDPDCDDGDPDMHPDAAEICEDGVDQDCNDADAPCGPYGGLESDAVALRFTGRAFGDALGTELAVGPDVDGDGLPEVWIGAPGVGVDEEANVGTAYRVTGDLRGSYQASAVARGSVSGEDESDYAGQGLAAADLDGDGVADLALGAGLYDGDTGLFRSGVAVFLVPVTRDLVWSDAEVIVLGQEENSWSIGDELTSFRDDGDAPTLVLGAEDWDETQEEQAAGRVFLAPVHETPLTDAEDLETYIRSSGADAQLGGVVEAADLNGDGVHDLLTHAKHDRGVFPGRDNKSVAMAFHGPFHGPREMADADAVWSTGGTADDAGKRVDAGADFDDDGLADVVLTAPSWSGTLRDSGAVFVVHGASEGVFVDVSAMDPIFYVEGIEVEGQFGYGEVAGGDVDGDGLSDLVAGWPGADDMGDVAVGAAMLFYGPLKGARSSAEADFTLWGTDPGLALGHKLVLADVDVDGFDDLLVGSQTGSTQDADSAGFAWVVFGGPPD